VVLLDARDRVLMFRGTDPGRPGSRYWFTAGGGVDEGETLVDAAIRELWEETGLRITPDQLGPSLWQETTDFPFNGRWFRQDQDFFVVRVEAWEVSVDGFGEDERISIDGHRWWSAAEIEATTEKIYPLDLAARLRGLLQQAGDGGR
jgi:8-oxo-dGTP pyrophosphatase MutT (NUDIX family)